MNEAALAQDVPLIDPEDGPKDGEAVLSDPEASAELDMYMVVGLNHEGGLLFDPGDLPPEMALLLLQQAILQVEINSQLATIGTAVDLEDNV